ncbi:MAG: polyphenol oxidase family protein [Thermoanaerobaculia bacterium]|nr:polyphenol oxidase family protein [Thermoanaerobaculia bacterium]
MGSPSRLLETIAPEAPKSIAWLDQVHGATVLPAAPGRVGEADALVVSARGLVLVIATADCVPVILVGPGGMGAIHAGWRGLVAGVVGETARHLERVTGAWVGPSIGPCCYEVGDEVARAVVAASDRRSLRHGSGPKPRLDLRRAVRSQLENLSIPVRKEVPLCTGCHADLLHSYRRQGQEAGRNLTFVWRERRGVSEGERT